MEQDRAELALERRHLEHIIGIARAQWQEMAQRNQQRAEGMQAAQEEMLERVTYDTGGLYSAQGFQDLLELSQMVNPLAEETHTQQTDEQAMSVLARMMQKPYFARIDFRFEDEPEAEKIYIGRATLMEPDALAIHVHDWRTPIASVFYRFGTGPAHYDAPAGLVEGEVRLKRQYEIVGGELRYYFDVDVQVVDAFLRDLLSRPASTAMKSIVETIQRDQDAVIRDVDSDLLMVQGVAGSGKTSVALHRVAYLMYEGLAGRRLSPEDILILSPNAVFERYISHVLPELGERQARTMIFEELFAWMLPGVQAQSRSAWVEAWLDCRDPQQKDRMRRVRAFKGSRAFVTLLDRLVHELPRRWLPFCDVDYAGRRVAWGGLARVQLCNSKKNVPIGTRLQWLEHEIFARVHALRPARMAWLTAFAGRYPQHMMEVGAYARMLSIAESAELLKRVRAFTQIDCQALYRALFADKEAFARLSKGLLPEAEAEAIRLASCQALADALLPYEDAAALAYLQARVHGCRSYAHIHQTVIDEAQDVDALHVTLLGLLFPRARFTILGDVHQTVAGMADRSLYTQMQGMLNRPRSALVEMDKSYRCTREIWAFGASFLPDGEAGQCFSRSGEAPSIHAAPDTGALDAQLARAALACQNQGCATVALICKTEREARALHARLKDRLDLRLVRDDGALDAEGLFVIPLYVAKGLEFDAVLVCDADAAHYADQEDARLLYVACTRALHRLHVFYVGSPSPLLPETDGMRGGEIDAL